MMKKKFLITLVSLCTMLFAFGAINASASEIVYVANANELQSEHSYAPNTDKTWVYIYPSNVELLKITFSINTLVEPDVDYIYILDGNDNLVGRYSGFDLAAETIEVPGNIVKIRLTSNSFGQFYGFAVRSIQPGFKTSKVVVAEGSSGVDIKWELYDNGVLNIEGEGIIGFNWVSTADAPWDSHRSLIKKVFIEEGITKIPYMAFRKCENLTNILIPDTVKRIEEWAFAGCKSLTSIEIPDDVTSIGDNAFIGCSSLTSIEIPDGVTSIGDNAFNGCSSLTSIEIPDGVTSIGYCTFYGCRGLTNISIPDTVTYIDDYAFGTCIGLKSITIPNGVTSIGSYAFYDCWTLASVEISNGVTSIGSYAFSGCMTLASVEIPDSVTSIGRCAFEYCNSLKSITISENLNSLFYGVFGGCSSLTSITIPNSITSIAESAFGGCSSLTSVNYNGSIDDWNNIDIGRYNYFLTDAVRNYFWYVVYIDENGNTIQTDMVALDSMVTLPDIDAEGFYANKELTEKFEQTTKINENTTIYVKVGYALLSSATKTDTGYSVNVIFDKDKIESFEEATLIAALYDKYGKFIGMNKVPVLSTDTSLPIAVETTETATTAKLMFWDGLSTLRPLCNGAEITIN